MLSWIMVWWPMHAVAAQLAVRAAYDTLGIPDGAMAFSGVVLLYLARQVMRLKDEVVALSQIPTAVERIEVHVQGMGNLLAAQRVEIANVLEDVRHHSEKLEACPYHGPDRRHEAGGGSRHG